MGTALVLLADLYVAKGDYVRAMKAYERALELRQKALGEKHPAVAAVLNSLGNLNASQGDYARAETFYRQAIAVRRATMRGAEDLLVTQYMSNLAQILTARGTYPEAQAILQHILPLLESRLGENHPELAPVLNCLASLAYELGDYAQSQKAHERALKIIEDSSGRNHPDVASVLSNLANTYMEQGLYAKAEPLFERAVAISESALGPSNPSLISSLGSLAILYARQGDPRATSVAERMFEVVRENFGARHVDVAIALTTLAKLALSHGDSARAVQLHEQALELRQSLLSENHPLVVASRLDLARAEGARGHLERAKRLHEQALPAMQEALGENHPQVAHALMSLANIYMRQGHFASAESKLQRALTIQEKGLGPTHPDVARSLNDIARIHLAQGRLDDALALLERAFLIQEEILRREVFGFSGARLEGVLSVLQADEDLLYALVREHPGNARLRHLALSTTLLRKGRSVGEAANTSRTIYHGLGPAERESFERLRTLRTQLARWSFSEAASAPEADLQQYKELVTRAEALEVQLSRRSAAFRTSLTAPSPTELVQKVAANLPRDGVLVEFVAYTNDTLVSRPTMTTRRKEDLNYLALLLFSDGRTAALELGAAGPIDALALSLHETLTRRDSSLTYLGPAQALHARVVRPLERMVGEARRLLLSTDGQLALVPFEALHDGQGFLMDRFDITYLTSGQDLVRRSQEQTPARSVVILADPDFGHTRLASSQTLAHVPPLHTRAVSRRPPPTLRGPESPERFWPPTPLPGTRREAEAIQELLPQSRMLLGPAATKDALLGLESPGILHIATHGFFLEDAPEVEAGRAAATFGGYGLPRRLPANPLLRSGLLLAGHSAPAYASPSRMSEKDIVTALEMEGLNLWGTQLVVLSACDTGRGEVKLGQGVYGLRRALVTAGAQTVVTSLWKVDDDVTRQLMERYYQNLLEGQGRIEALRSAMKALRRTQPHPHYWAPFIAMGRDTPLEGFLGPRTARRP
ncbi:tetratricopeptide repeat protein [Melittangium boletus]|uniref:CHAT domain-containing tetratricopeptide repeat protein n=1 Tax=Melittangium boletus TaxID=83453 RepID=UPI003DA5F602